MLTLEDRILRIELLTEIVTEIPEGILDYDKIQEYRKIMSIFQAKRKCIVEYFKSKDTDNFEEPSTGAK